MIKELFLGAFTRSFGQYQIKVNISPVPCNKREKTELKIIFCSKNKNQSHTTLELSPLENKVSLFVTGFSF